MGLLDQFSNMSPEQTQGLLAAASQMLQQSGPSRMPTSFGQVVGGGLGAYQGAMTEAKIRKQQEEQAAQMAQMRDLQMQEMQGQLGDQQRSRSEQEAILKAAKDAYRTPEQQASSLPGGPTIENAARIPEMTGGMDTSAFLRSVEQVNPLKAMELRKQFAPKDKQIHGTEIGMRDGQPVRIITFKDGTEQVSAFDPKADVREVNLGNKKQFVDFNRVQNGQSFNMGVAPDTVYSGGITMRGQDMNDSRARDLNAIGQDANAIKRAEKQKDLDMTKSSQVASFDTMLGTLGRLGQHPGLARSVGISGAFPTLPGTEAANFQAELDTFQSQAFIPMVAQLKGMGALSDAEGKKLTAAVGALNPKMGEKAFRDSIGRIVDEMENAKARVSGVPREAAKPPPKSVLRGQVIDGYRFKGGDPSQQSNWEKQ